MNSATSLILNRYIRLLKSLGSFSIFLSAVGKTSFTKKISLKLLFQQIAFVGQRSVLIVLISGIMVGGIFGFQLAEIFKLFGAESMIGASTAFALTRELGPIFCAFLVTARAGSAMAAEIASMKVNEQIDAMRVMCVDPFAYLVVPRVIASFLVLPLLNVFFVIAGVFASYLVGILFYQVDIADFYSKIQWIVQPGDLSMGMQKAAIFGALLSLIGCFSGLRAQGGAKGVGQSTTTAVVTSYVLVLVSDFFISYLQYQGFKLFFI